MLSEYQHTCMYRYIYKNSAQVARESRLFLLARTKEIRLTLVSDSGTTRVCYTLCSCDIVVIFIPFWIKVLTLTLGHSRKVFPETMSVLESQVRGLGDTSGGEARAEQKSEVVRKGVRAKPVSTHF